MMRYLGIDFGSKKIGIALSDEAGQMAFPREVILNDVEMLTYVEHLIAEENVGEIVIGYSLDKDGKENPIHAAAEEFITDLTLACGLPIHLEPEQYTSQQAARVQGRDSMMDASAAALILEGFLARRRQDSAFDELNS